MGFEAGDENPLYKGLKEHDRVMTFMEATSDEIHDSLNDVIGGQTYYRLVSILFGVIEWFLRYIFGMLKNIHPKPNL